MFDASQWPALDADTAALLDRADDVAVLNKADLVDVPAEAMVDGRSALVLSAKTGAGLAALLARLEAAVRARVETAAGPGLTRARHRRALEETAAALERAMAATAPELLAEDLRLAARALGRLTGRVDVEDLLDIIFRDFCIGK